MYDILFNACVIVIIAWIEMLFVILVFGFEPSSDEPDTLHIGYGDNPHVTKLIQAAIALFPFVVLCVIIIIVIYVIRLYTYTMGLL